MQLNNDMELRADGNLVNEAYVDGQLVYVANERFENVKVSGETLVIEDVANEKPVAFRVFGRSEQNQYSGKNLINVSLDFDWEIYSTSRVCRKIINVGANKEVTISCKKQFFNYISNGISSPIYCVSGSNIDFEPISNINGCGNSNIPIPITVVADSNGFITVGIWKDIVESADKTYEIQLELGSSVTSYEPYCGGIPSPNPEYPQDIVNVENPTVSIGIDSNSSTKDITIPFTLRGIGDVKDELVVYQDGSGKLIKRIEHCIFSGSDDEHYNTRIHYNNHDNVSMAIALSNCGKEQFSTKLISNIASSPRQWTTDDRLCIFINEYREFIVGGTPLAKHQTNVSIWKEYLKLNPITLIYELQTPIETQLTPEQVQSILPTLYRPTTTIWNDQNAEMSLIYGKYQRNTIQNLSGGVQS